MFTVFLSTNPQVQKLEPPEEISPSFRARDGWFLFPPITELLPFDMFAQPNAILKEHKKITLATATDPDVVLRFGRPL